MTARERLADRQAELLAALVDGAPVPPGFDEARVAAEARVLRTKRRRVLGRIVTGFLDDEGRAAPADLDDRLDRWVDRPRRTGTGFHDDARAFVASLPAPPRRWWRPFGKN